MTASVDQALDRLRRQNGSIPEPGTTLTIAEMAERAGVSAHTLRYYERIGLIDVGRDAAGRRLYGAEEFSRVVFLTRLRMTGMPIRDLQRYMALVGEGDATVPLRRAMLEHQRDAIRIHLLELQFALETVELKLTSYGGACAP